MRKPARLPIQPVESLIGPYPQISCFIFIDCLYEIIADQTAWVIGIMLKVGEAFGSGIESLEPSTISPDPEYALTVLVDRLDSPTA